MVAASEGDALAAASRPDGTPAERALAEAGERAVLLLRFAEGLAGAGGVADVCATIVEQCRDGPMNYVQVLSAQWRPVPDSHPRSEKWVSLSPGPLPFLSFSLLPTFDNRNI